MQSSFQNTIMGTLGLVIEECNDETLHLSMSISQDNTPAIWLAAW